MQLSDCIEPLRKCAQALIEGHNPVEVAEALGQLAVEIEDATRDVSADLAISALLRRVAVLESRQQQDSAFAQRITMDLGETDQRLDNIAAAMRECAKKEALHPSVRFICDTIALNLAPPTGGHGNDAR